MRKLVSVGCGLAGVAVLLTTMSMAAQSLLVVNQVDVSVSVIDPVTAKVVATIAENTTGVHGHEAAVSADGKTAFVPVYGSVGVGKPGIDGDEILVVDLASRKIRAHIKFDHGVRPHFPLLEPVSGMLYVTTELDKTVTVIDPKTLKIVGAVPTGQEQSHMLAISHDGLWGYTANVGPGTVSVLDLKSRKTAAVIPIAGVVQRISISMDDKLVFTSDNTKPQLAVIDTATRKVKQWIPLPAKGYGSAATRDGRWLLLALPTSDAIAVIDLQTMTVARQISVGKLPQEIVLRPDGKMAYVSCVGSGNVAAIDLGTWSLQGMIAAGHGADGLAWAR